MIVPRRRWQARARRLAVLGAVVLLSAQLLGAIHSHRLALSGGVTGQSHLSEDNGLCALCLLAFHSPTNPASAPWLTDPGFGGARCVACAWAKFRSLLGSISRGRAPPAAA